MIVLDKTTRKLQIVLGSAPAAELYVQVVYFDEVRERAEGTGEIYKSPHRTQLSRSNNTTDADICDAPALPNAVRNIEKVSVHNSNAGAVTATIKIDDSGTDSITKTHAIGAGQTLNYENQYGWSIN